MNGFARRLAMFRLLMWGVVHREFGLPYAVGLWRRIDFSVPDDTID